MTCAMLRRLAMIVALMGLQAPTALAADDPQDRIEIISGRDGAYAVYSMMVKIDADPDTVWAIVGDWSLSNMKSAFLDRVETNGSGNGATRTLYAKEAIGGGHITELQHDRDDVRRTHSYALLESGPLPWADYRGTTTVTGMGNGASLIFYDVRFIPYKQSHAEAIALSIENNRAWMIDLVRRFQPGR